MAKSDTGDAQRTLQTTHEKIKPKLRANVLLRSGNRCELCGKRDCLLTVGHLLSVKDGHENGLTDDEINDPENLASMCEECNAGMSSLSVPLRLAIAFLKSRLRSSSKMEEQ
jgi:5-methylcytosine-specific restriction endonuclease McrA